MNNSSIEFTHLVIYLDDINKLKLGHLVIPHLPKEDNPDGIGEQEKLEKAIKKILEIAQNKIMDTQFKNEKVIKLKIVEFNDTGNIVAYLHVYAYCMGKVLNEFGRIFCVDPLSDVYVQAYELSKKDYFAKNPFRSHGIFNILYETYQKEIIDKSVEIFGKGGAI